MQQQGAGTLTLINLPHAIENVLGVSYEEKEASILSNRQRMNLRLSSCTVV